MSRQHQDPTNERFWKSPLFFDLKAEPKDPCVHITFQGPRSKVEHLSGSLGGGRASGGLQ